MDKGNIFETLIKQTAVVIIIIGVILLVVSSTQIPIGSNVLMVTDIAGRILLIIIGGVLLVTGVFLSVREQVKTNPSNKKTSKEHPFFFPCFPDRFKDEFDNCTDVWMTGVSLDELMDFANIEDKLKKGHTIKVLLINPMDYSLEIAVSRSYGPADVERRRNETLNVLKDLCTLKQDHKQQIEIHTIKYPLSHKIIALNPASSEGVLYIHHYAYKPNTNKLPHFKLSCRDGIYYKFFNKELETLWGSSQNWECPT
jgi:hypothetical protein